VVARDGTIVVSGADGSTETITAGKAATVKRGKSSKSYALIDFPSSRSPGIDARFQCLDDTRISLQWKRVRRAKKYVVQVAKDLGFQEIISTATAAKTSYELTPSGQGLYAWRVAALDRRGVRSEFGFARRIYCQADPVVELLVTPRHGAKFAMAGTEKPTIRFAWRSAGSSKSYRFVIARGNDSLSKPVFEKTTSGQKLKINSLKAGSYRWGVFAEGDKAIFARPRRLYVGKQRAPKANAKGLWDD